MTKIMITLLTILTLFSCDFNKKEVLKATLQFDGTCCDGSLTLYSDNTFKIVYSNNENTGKTCKGNYSFEEKMLVLDNSLLTSSNQELLIDEVSDLFTSKYQFSDSNLTPIKGSYDLKVNFFDKEYFKDKDTSSN